MQTYLPPDIKPPGFFIITQYNAMRNPADIWKDFFCSNCQGCVPVQNRTSLQNQNIKNKQTGMQTCKSVKFECRENDLKSKEMHIHFYSFIQFYCLAYTFLRYSVHQLCDKPTYPINVHTVHVHLINSILEILICISLGNWLVWMCNTMLHYFLIGNYALLYNCLPFSSDLSSGLWAEIDDILQAL